MRIALSTLMLTSQAIRAEEPPSPGRPDIKYPLVYSTSLMALYLPVLMAADVYDSGPSFNNFERAFTRGPRWDPDTPVFNFALHPLWGSETYLRARESNLGVAGSLAFSLGMSATWEYLLESWVEHPSTQDLVFTTGLGWGIGELRYRLKQRTDDRKDWFLDPIQKTLEHLRIVTTRDERGKLAGALGLSFRF